MDNADDFWEVTVTVKVKVDARHGPGMAHETGRRIIQRAIYGLPASITDVSTEYKLEKK